MNVWCKVSGVDQIQLIQCLHVVTWSLSPTTYYNQTYHITLVPIPFLPSSPLIISFAYSDILLEIPQIFLNSFLTHYGGILILVDITEVLILWEKNI